MLTYVIRAIAFGLSRLANGGRPESSHGEDYEHAHWDRERREWVVRRPRLDRAA